MPLSVVYVLTNPAMPSLVKIGKTQNEDAAIRMAQLYTTGVPFPFNIEFVCRVENSDEVEKALHQAFAPQRVNPKREFFQIEASQAIAILKLLHVEDETDEFQAILPVGIEKSETAAAERFTKRRPKFKFDEMGIPVGSILTSTVNENFVTVVEPRKVMLNDEKISLTSATKQSLGLEYTVASGPYWRFEGKLLSEIYDETYTEDN
jgi:T5orf172 domain